MQSFLPTLLSLCEHLLHCIFYRLHQQPFMKFVLYTVPWDKPNLTFLEWVHNTSFIVFSISLFYIFERMKVLSTENSFTWIYSRVLVETLGCIFNYIYVDVWNNFNHKIRNCIYVLFLFILNTKSHFNALIRSIWHKLGRNRGIWDNDRAR